MYQESKYLKNFRFEAPNLQKKEGRKMKRSSKTSTIVMICSMFLFILFLIHQFTLSSIARSSSSSNSTQGKSPKLRTAQSLWVPKSADVQIRSIAAASGEPPSHQIICDRSHYRYDICTINGPTTIDPSSSTVFMVGPTPQRNQNVRPYPRKWENSTMSRIKQLTLITATDLKTQCQVQHQAPAIVFSAGGYTGNLFHDFNDGFIPLFVTVRSFFSNGDYPILVIADCRDWWLNKYAALIKHFTPYPIINLDTDTSTHCFPSATIGLISHGYMTINPKLLPNKESFLHFRALLGSAYGSSLSLKSNQNRPRLVLVGRTGNVGRVIRNQAELAVLAKEVGFEVSVFEPTTHTSLNEAYKLINRSHAMLGVHGAALTHSLFLRPGSVLIQVVPIGVDWLGETCFGKPARDLKFDYMEYKIELEESSLIEKYGKDDLVLSNPKAVTKAAWSNTNNIYLKNQDVKVDLVRMGKYLREAYNKAKIFMDKEG